jgi:hypothetical protein
MHPTGAQPVCEGVRLAVAQQVHRLAGLRVDQDGSVVPAAAEREIIQPRTFTVPGSGSGRAMTSRSRLDRPAVRSSRAASRSPARPARASAIPVSMRASGGVRRARGEVRPSTCSAKVTAAQPGLPQKKQRTASRMTTGWPPTGASASRRPYVLCTRPDAWPHRGHTAWPARARTHRHKLPASSAASTTTPDRCGSSRSRLISCRHDRQPLNCDNDKPDSWADGWRRQPPTYQESFSPLGQHTDHAPEQTGSLQAAHPVTRGSLPSRNTGQIHFRVLQPRFAIPSALGDFARS